MGGKIFGLGGGDAGAVTPLSNDLALSRTLTPLGVKGGDSRSIGSLVTAASFFGEVIFRGVGTGRGFLAGGGADPTP